MSLGRLTVIPWPHGERRHARLPRPLRREAGRVPGPARSLTAALNHPDLKERPHHARARDRRRIPSRSDHYRRDRRAQVMQNEARGRRLGSLGPRSATSSAIGPTSAALAPPGRIRSFLKMDRSTSATGEPDCRTGSTTSDSVSARRSHGPMAALPHSVRDEWGTDIVDELKPDPGDVVVTRRGSAASQTGSTHPPGRRGSKSLIAPDARGICVSRPPQPSATTTYSCGLRLSRSGLTPRTNHEAISSLRTVFGAVSTSGCSSPLSTPWHRNPSTMQTEGGAQHARAAPARFPGASPERFFRSGLIRRRRRCFPRLSSTLFSVLGTGR